MDCWSKSYVDSLDIFDNFLIASYCLFLMYVNLLALLKNSPYPILFIITLPNLSNTFTIKNLPFCYFEYSIIFLNPKVNIFYYIFGMRWFNSSLWRFIKIVVNCSFFCVNVKDFILKNIDCFSLRMRRLNNGVLGTDGWLGKGWTV